MKRIYALAAVSLTLSGLAANAQDDKPPSVTPPKEEALLDDLKIDDGETSTLPSSKPAKQEPPAAVVELPESLKGLSDSEREHLQKLLIDASKYIGGIRIQEAFEKLIEAEEMAPNLFQLHNLKGAAYTKIRAFDKARICFERAIELEPKAFVSKFNITELDFVEHKFADAEKNFQELIDLDPKIDMGTKRLIEFKILVSMLGQDKVAEANDIQKRFNYLEDTPAYYFGNAAFAFAKDDEDEARGWIRSAERIYTPQEVSVYVDSFIEMKWIDNLQ